MTGFGILSSMAEKRVLLHAGTHKTGTKTIQSFLKENRDALLAAGLYVPETGRRRLSETLATPGQHLLAHGLLRGDAAALVQALVEEVREADGRTVVISSEHFQYFHDRGALLEPLLRPLAALGYEAVLTFYAREQVGYLESIYLERVKNAAPGSFDEFYAEIITNGAVRGDAEFPVVFDYARMAEGFSHVFDERIIVRPYAAGGDSLDLIRDFLGVLTTLHGALPLSKLGVSYGHVNGRFSFGHVLGALYRFAVAADPQAPEPAALLPALGFDANDPMLALPAALLSREERLAVVRRFAPENARAMAKITLPGVRETDVPPNDAPIWATAQRHRAILASAQHVWFSGTTPAAQARRADL